MLLKTTLEVQRLSLEEKVSQMVMIDIPDRDGLSAETREHLRRYPFNGVVLFAKNVRDRAQLVSLVNELHEVCPIQPLLTVDQEGGLVDRFRFPDMSLAPGNMALGATFDPECTRQAYRIMGSELRNLGMHLDFAPCLDVNCNPANPIIGVRSFGEDPAQVAAHGRSAIEGLREGGVGATAKHFPGHGDTSLDSHICLPTVAHSRQRMEVVELVPFQAAVQAQVEAVMTAHITFPAFDERPGIPATLSSPTLNGLLRQQMGYTGVIITDSLAMQAIADHFGKAEAAIQSVEAGSDIVLSCGNFEDHVEMVRGLIAAVESGRLSAARLDQSLERIFALKTRYAQPANPQVDYDVAAHQQAMRSVVDRTITLLRNQGGLLPLRPESAGKVLVLTPDMLPMTPLGEMSSTHHLQLPGLDVDERFYHAASQGPATRALVEAASQAHTVVMSVYARDRLSDLQAELARAVTQANPRTVLVSLSSPYLLRDVPGAAAYLIGYNYTPFSLEAVGRVLSGQLNPTGRVPVSLPGFFERGQGFSFTS